MKTRAHPHHRGTQRRRVSLPTVLSALGVLFGLLVSCQTPPAHEPYGPTKEKEIQAVAAIKLNAAANGSAAVSAEALTGGGDNSQGKFSPDGKSVIYVSSQRAEHQHGQVYELTIGKHTERRLSYHDGDDYDPSYFPDGERYLYASATDNLKSERTALAKLVQTYSRQNRDKAASNKREEPNLELLDIYSSRLDGNEITRLTNLEGFDAQPLTDKTGLKIIFTGHRQSTMGLYFMSTSGKQATMLTDEATRNSNAALSADGKWLAWVRSDDKTAQTSLVLNEIQWRTKALQKPTKAIEGFTRIHSLAWHPDGKRLVLSAQRTGDKMLRLYIVNFEPLPGSEPIVGLTSDDIEQTFPCFSPDGKLILFTSRTTPFRQLFLADFSLLEKASKP